MSVTSPRKLKRDAHIHEGVWILCCDTDVTEDTFASTLNPSPYVNTFINRVIMSQTKLLLALVQGNFQLIL